MQSLNYICLPSGRYDDDGEDIHTPVLVLPLPESHDPNIGTFATDPDAFAKGPPQAGGVELGISKSLSVSLRAGNALEFIGFFDL